MDIKDKEVLVNCDSASSEILAMLPWVVGGADECSPRLLFSNSEHFNLFERFVYLLDGLEAPVKDDWGMTADVTISIKDFPKTKWADLQRDYAPRHYYVGDFKVGICREPEIDDEVAMHVELRNFFSLEDGINCCYSVKIDERKFNFMNVPEIHDLLDMYITISQMDVIVTCENTLAYHLSTWMGKPTFVYCSPGVSGKGEFFPYAEGYDWRKAISDVKERIAQMRDHHDA